jgi:hypothetical protein
MCTASISTNINKNTAIISKKHHIEAIVFNGKSIHPRRRRRVVSYEDVKELVTKVDRLYHKHDSQKEEDHFVLVNDDVSIYSISHSDHAMNDNHSETCASADSCRTIQKEITTTTTKVCPPAFVVEWHFRGIAKQRRKHQTCIPPIPLPDSTRIIEHQYMSS